MFGISRTKKVGAALLIFSAFLASQPACNAVVDGGPVSSPCAPGERCQTKLTLLHTSDIHSRLLPYDLLITQVDAGLGLGPLGEVRNVGGVSRLSYVIGRERARAGRALHLDSGDCFQGAPIFNFFAGEPEVRSLSLMGIDAAVIGNHEFDRGALNVTIQFGKWANFSSLAANYKFDDPSLPSSPKLASFAKPFQVFNMDGLKVAVIGMANLSSMTSLFDQPNRQGVTAMNTVETAQAYIDLLRPSVDLIVMLTHLGLEVDQRMVRGTTGIDIVLGGHNHVVINPPQQIRDCSADPRNPGYVWAVDPNLEITPDGVPPKDDLHPDPEFHPFQFRRKCLPRNVLIAHSGSFAKYVGRLDLQVSNVPSQVSPTSSEDDYDAVNGFEVLSSQYTPIPIDDSVPKEPIVERMLEPYARVLDNLADLDTLVGFAPATVRRTSPLGGDSALGNLVAAAIWLRLGVQTDFSLTNTTGIRADINPGPITIESMYNVFPFDNSISKMQLSGLEVQELFDFVSRRSGARGCTAQAQIAGARVSVNCTKCERPNAKKPEEPCADRIFIGHKISETDPEAFKCTEDEQCPATEGLGMCDPIAKQCMNEIHPTNLYELATSNYLAGGGSGYRVLQRNTTQIDTKIQQRDALIDYIREGKPCGYDIDKNPDTKGLAACESDNDCKGVGTQGEFVCACPSGSAEGQLLGQFTCVTRTEGCSKDAGRCVLRACRDGVAQFQNRACESNPNKQGCRDKLNACSNAGETCKFLACVDEHLGAITDNRMEMTGR